jgi:sugar O-acyltransferase (sialic acid O-acetyltransferase NeuD family)
MAIDDPSDWLIFAHRTPYAAEVAEIIWRCGQEVRVLVDNLDDGPLPSELGTVVAPDDLDADLVGLATVIPQLTPGHRRTIEHQARELGITRFPVLVDPTAVVARRSTLGEGTVVNAAAVVGATSTLGRFVHVNRSASVGHDAVIADYATIGPACALAGHVTLGPGAFVGAGAVLAPKVTIGANAVVGAGAVVVRDVPAGAVVVGNPATILRQGDAGYGGVSVPVEG